VWVVVGGGGGGGGGRFPVFKQYVWWADAIFCTCTMPNSCMYNVSDLGDSNKWPCSPQSTEESRLGYRTCWEELNKTFVKVLLASESIWLRSAGKGNGHEENVFLHTHKIKQLDPAGSHLSRSYKDPVTSSSVWPSSGQVIFIESNVLKEVNNVSDEDSNYNMVKGSDRGSSLLYSSMTAPPVGHSDIIWTHVHWMWLQ